MDDEVAFSCYEYKYKEENLSLGYVAVSCFNHHCRQYLRKVMNHSDLKLVLPGFYYRCMLACMLSHFSHV